nr:uncharacterized protein LOC129452396 [Misgurnus anguillicaudatus]
MEIFKSRILHPSLCVFLTLYAVSQCSMQKIQHHIYKTVFVGKTVTLSCNKTLDTDDITWKMNSINIFSYSSFNNKSMKNFSSDRMYTDPAIPTELKIIQIQTSDAGNYSCYSSTTAIKWILTVKENNKSLQLFEPALLYIIGSCAGGCLIIGLIIALIVCIHRRRTNNRDCADRSQAPVRRQPTKKTYDCMAGVEDDDQCDNGIYENYQDMS